jgi:phosphatidylglycerophosphatase C
MKKTLALFDFDNTITYVDSSLSFYKFLYNSKILFLYNHYFLCFNYVLLNRFRLINYLKLKRKRLDIHTSKFDDSQLLNLSEVFYEKCFHKILNPKAIQRINWHKNQGHELWVISASYDFILEKWTRKIGVMLLTNKTFYNNGLRIQIGNDMNFEEKVNAIKNVVNLDEYNDIYAYGDSEGDNQMLGIATKKYYKYFN